MSTESFGCGRKGLGFSRERESWRVSQVTEHRIELQGVDGEIWVWEKGVGFSRLRERELLFFFFNLVVDNHFFYPYVS